MIDLEGVENATDSDFPLELEIMNQTNMHLEVPALGVSVEPFGARGPVKLRSVADAVKLREDLKQLRTLGKYPETAYTLILVTKE